ncbi:MAG: nucleotidyltransferase family protein [Deltaproteobacteria bacterium]|nr:nucleotidyltransferase family protein [Deltaproteobacteria bacterium]
MSTRAINMLRAAELERVRALVEARGLGLLFLKGMAFVDTLYPDPGERPMCDADLLVRPDERAAVARLLVEQGYRRPGGAVARERPVTCATDYELGLRSPPPLAMSVELHSGFCQPQRYQVDLAGVWRRAVRLRAAGREIPTLAAEDQLLYLALHLSKHGFMADGRVDEDIRRAIAQWRPDWRVVVERARQWRIRTGLYVALLRARSAGAEVPATVLDELRPGLARRLLMDRIVDRRDGYRSRQQRWSRGWQAVTVLLSVEHPANLARFVASYGALRARDWYAARRQRSAVEGRR